jgi:hypothetical protein
MCDGIDFQPYFAPVDPRAPPPPVPDRPLNDRGPDAPFRFGANAPPEPPRRGRPRRPPPRTAEVEAIMRREFDVYIAGEPMRLPLAQALLMQLAHRALRGEIWAVQELMKTMGQAEKTRAREDAAHARREVERARNNAALRARRKAEAEAAAREAAKLKIFWSPVTLAKEEEARAPECREADEAMELHGAALDDALASLGVLGPEDDQGLGPRRLEPWVVEAARARDPERWAALRPQERAAVQAAMDGPDWGEEEVLE